MVSKIGGIEELNETNMTYLKNVLAIEKSDEEASLFFCALIEEALNTNTTIINFFIHNLAHPTV